MAANVAFGSQATRSSQIRSGFKRPSSVRFRRDGVGLAPHVEFAIVLMGGAEAEPLIEPFGRVRLHYPERHRLMQTRCLVDEAMHDGGADATSLPGRLDKKLAEEICGIM